MVKMVLFPTSFPDCGYPPYLVDEPVANSARKIQSHPPLPPALNASDSQKPVSCCNHSENIFTSYVHKSYAQVCIAFIITTSARKSLPRPKLVAENDGSG